MIQPPAIIQEHSVLDLPALLSAIAAVESGYRDNVVGKLGERGRYQFSRALWTKWSTLPFTDAFDRDLATLVMTKGVLAWKDQLLNEGVSVQSIPRFIVTWFCAGRNYRTITPKKQDEIDRILVVYDATAR